MPVVILGIFLFLNTLSFVDRSILSMLVVPIQKDLGITDFQMSMLLGPAFGFFYVVCGLGLGWAADHWSTRWVILIGVVIWGMATALSGFATSYVGLLAGRIGVGVGESAVTPTAHAVIAEEFPEKRLSTAMSIFSLGTAAGGGVAVAIGGLLAEFTAGTNGLTLPVIGNLHPWQCVLLIIGIISLLAAPLAFLVPDRRLNYEKLRHRAAIERGTERADPTTLWQLLRRDWLLFICGPIGFGFISAISIAYNSWIPTFMVREYGWGIGSVGAAWGLQHSICGAAGYLLAALIVDRWYSRGKLDAHTIYPVLSLVVSVPFAIWGFLCGNPWLFLILNTVYYLLSYGYLGYAAASIQMFCPPHLRGQVAGVFLAIVTVVGSGLGPPVAGWFTDTVFGSKDMIGLSLIASTLVFAPLSMAILLAVRRKTMQMHSAHYAK